MLARINLFHGALDVAAEQLDAAIELAQRDHWLAFLPWPQALQGEVQLAQADPAGASALLQQAFARACRLGDPCREGISARGLALVAAAAGETSQAFTLLFDARARANRLADPYVWLDGYILDAQCQLGRQHGHPDTPAWVETLRTLASRTGMNSSSDRCSTARPLAIKATQPLPPSSPPRSRTPAEPPTRARTERAAPRVGSWVSISATLGRGVKSLAVCGPMGLGHGH